MFLGVFCRGSFFFNLGYTVSGFSFIVDWSDLCGLIRDVDGGGIFGCRVYFWFRLRVLGIETEF